MECIKTESVLLETPHRKVVKATKAKEDRKTRTNSRSRATDTSLRVAEFALFAQELQRELDPRGPFEALFADHVTQSAWHLKSILDRQGNRNQEFPHQAVVDGTKKPSGSQADRAAKSLRDALESFDSLKARRSTAPSLDITIQSDVDGNEWPIVPSDGLDDFLDDGEIDPIEDDTPHWRDRLIFDFEVSDVSPVVKGTWITVSHIVSLIVDGWTWADILRSHPELSEDDIRTCVAYAMAEENSTN